MHHPSSRHLTHDFIAYKGLSIRELFILSGLSMLNFGCLFGILGLCFGFCLLGAGIGIVAGFILSLSYLPKPVAKIKAGKPHGFLFKTLKLKLIALKIIKSPYLFYQGRWDKTKRLGGKHV